MTCPKCGNEQRLSVVCMRCGAAMDEAPAPWSRLGAPLETGELLGKTFSLYFRNLPFFLVLSIVAFSPLLLLFVLILQRNALEAQGAAPMEVMVLAYGLPLFCGPLTVALTTDGVFRLLRGEEASLGDGLRTGFGPLFPVLAVAVLYSLTLVIGFVLCLVPGFVFMTMYSVAVPALLMERVGPRAAMTRSAHLTKGYRWPLFGVLFLIGLIDAGLGQFAEMVLDRSGEEEDAVYLLTANLLGIVPAGLSAIASVIAYHRLRGIKESYGLAETASVFD